MREERVQRRPVLLVGHAPLLQAGLKDLTFETADKSLQVGLPGFRKLFGNLRLIGTHHFEAFILACDDE